MSREIGRTLPGRWIAYVLAFAVLAGLSLFAIGYVGDRAVDPWPGYTR